jgi:hypothetical protein
MNVADLFLDWFGNFPDIRLFCAILWKALTKCQRHKVALLILELQVLDCSSLEHSWLPPHQSLLLAMLIAPSENTQKRNNKKKLIHVTCSK